MRNTELATASVRRLVDPAFSVRKPVRAAPVAERLAFGTLLSDISARLMAAAPSDIHEAIERALLDVRVFFRADRCGLLTVSKDRRECTVHLGSYSEGTPRVSGSLNLAELYPWVATQLMKRRQPVAITRMADLPPEAARDRAHYELIGTRSQLTVPIVTSGHVTHLIVVHSNTEEREWPRELVSRLRLLGELIVSALHRKEAFEAIRDSEERLTRTAAAAGCGLWELKMDDDRVWVTPETRRLYSLGANEAATYDRFVELLHPDDREAVVAVIDRVRSTAQSFDVQYRIVRDDGSVRWMRSVGKSDPGGFLRGASVDVTEDRDRKAALERALDEVKHLRTRLEQENAYLRREASRTIDPEPVTGRSAAIRHALALSKQVAPTTATVLLVGETGTGKERFAESIHQMSPRRERHMVRVNCSAIPGALIESELFGREKGAYTGALSKQIGRFELAAGSTLFLDEIGDLPMDVQVKLLRVLQERTIERLGSPTPVAVDVRIVAATNRDLEAAVRNGTFRADLYYRLNVFPIAVPALRQRRDDIPDLVMALVAELGAAMRKHFSAVEPDSLEALCRADWPGNIRELRNVLERAMILETGPTLRVALPQQRPPVSPEPQAPPPVVHDMRQVEREHILRVLSRTGWRIRGTGAAADILGVKATTLEARMARLGIRRPASPLSA